MNLIDNVRDLTGPDSFGEADVSVRGGAGIKWTEPTQQDAAIEWEMVYDATDADFVAIQTAYLAKSMIELALADAATGTAFTTGSGGVAGTKYTRMECKVFKFERSEQLAGGNLYSVAAKPCYSTHAITTGTVS
jgi:hypothetical protein